MSHRKECLAAFVAIDLTFFICGRMARVPLALSRTKVGYHVPLSNFENDPPIPCGSLSRLRGASFMCFLGRSLSVDLRYLASLSFFLLQVLFAVLDTFVARTFQMAFNRRSEPWRECGKQWRQRHVWWKKNGRRGPTCSPPG